MEPPSTTITRSELSDDSLCVTAATTGDPVLTIGVCEITGVPAVPWASALIPERHPGGRGRLTVTDKATLALAFVISGTGSLCCHLSSLQLPPKVAFSIDRKLLKVALRTFSKPFFPVEDSTAELFWRSGRRLASEEESTTVNG